MVIARSFRVCVAVLTASLALTLAPAVPAGAVTALPADLDLVVRGGGWGHGHGMSQYGARAQAAAGRTWRQILASYYSGVTIVDKGSQTIRVLLTSSSSFVVGGRERVSAARTSGSTIATSTSTYPFFRVRAVTDGIDIDKGTSASGPWSGVAVVSGTVRFVSGASVVPMPSGSSIRYYRGFIEANRRSSSNLYAINQLSLEQYLRGVVPRESPASWPLNALRAQAVAARSYTLWKKANSSGSYHICATTACQVYGGYGYRNSFDGPMTVLEHPNTNAAIADTDGDTMTSSGYAIFAEYHSSSGGHTSQGSRSYLAPRPDPWDATYSPYHRWTKRVAVADVERRWPVLGRLAGITAVGRDGDGPWGGRVKAMTLVGTSGNVTVSGDTFRISMGLRSTLFTVDIYDASVVSAPAEVLLAPGTSKTITVVLENTGNRAWAVGNAVTLATWAPKDRDTIFNDPSWVTATRPTGVDADLTGGSAAVSVGEHAEMTFTVTAASSASSGLYNETFRPVATSLTAFGPAFTIPIRVQFEGATHLGANVVRNASFEAIDGDLPDGWTRTAGTTADTRSSGTAVDGSGSLKLVGDTAATKSFRQHIAVAGVAGDRYVLSGWNRATGVGAGGAMQFAAAVRNTDGTSTDVPIDYPLSTHRWTYREKAFTAAKAFDGVDVTVSLAQQTGTAWFDRLRLVREDLLNPGFESGSATPGGWTLSGAPAGSGRHSPVVRSGVASLLLKGAPTRNAMARQTVASGGPAGERLTLSGWNRATATTTSGGVVRMSVVLRYSDGTSTSFPYDFPRAAHGWRYGQTTVTAAKPYARVDVVVRFAEQTGSAWFDELSLAPAGAPGSLAGNAGFELGAPRPGDWVLIDPASGSAVTSSAAAGSAALVLAGDPAHDRRARQSLAVAGVTGARFRLSGYSRTAGSDADAAPARVFATIRYADGTSGTTVVDYPAGNHDWLYRSAIVTTAKPYVRIEVSARYAGQTGTGSFDNVRLEPIA